MAMASRLGVVKGTERSTVVDAVGIPLGVLAAPANCHDSPLLGPPLDPLADLGPLPAQALSRSARSDH